MVRIPVNVFSLKLYVFLELVGYYNQVTLVDFALAVPGNQTQVVEVFICVNIFEYEFHLVLVYILFLGIIEILSIYLAIIHLWLSG